MPTTTTPTPTDRAAAVVATLEAAWNAGDGAAFAAPFVADADFVDVRGVHSRGREAVATGHQAIFDTIYAGSTLAYRVASVRPLTPEVAVVQIDAALEVPAGPFAGTLRARATLVVVETAEGPRAGSFHNTLVRDLGP